MADNKRIAKNTMFLYFRMLLIMGVGLFTSRVVLQTLGVEDYGIYGVVGGIVTMFSFLNGSLGTATSRFITFELGRNDYEELNKVFNVSLTIHILLGLAIVVLCETVGLWFLYNKMIIPEARMTAAFWVFQISILSTFFSLTQVPYNAVIIAYENMKIYSYVGIVDVLLKLVIVYLLVISPFDKLIYYALLNVIENIGVVIFYRFYCLRYYPESNFKICKDKKRYKEMFSFLGSDLIGSISVLAQGQGLNLLLNVFFGPVVNAARAIAYTVQGSVTQFGNNFMTAVRPQIIKLYAAGEIIDMFRLVHLSSNFSYYMMWFFILPISLEADYILKLWLGKYPDHTVSFLILIFILCLIQTLKTPRMAVIHATGKVFLVNIVVGTLLCFAFPLAYIFLKIGGAPETVFWAANITMFISEFVSVFILRKYVKYSITYYLLDVHFRCCVVTAVSFIIPYILYDRFMEPSFLRLLVTGVISTLSIFFTVWIIGMNKDMRIKAKEIFINKVLKCNQA